MSLERKIGFDKVRSMVSSKCSSQYAIDRVSEEQISCNKDEIYQRLVLTDEMRLICMFEDNFPSSGFIDTKEFLLPLQLESSFIDVVSLGKLRTSLETLHGILAFFRGCKDDLYPNLRQISSSITYYPEVGRRINAIIDKTGEIKDSASPTLTDIRRQLRDKEGTISRRIDSILRKAQGEGIVDEDASVSIRDGRILIPVVAANKKKLPGFVYDESASGRTAFIEPMEVIELNNQVRELQFEEQREIMRILMDFTDFLRPYLPELIASAEYIGEMDFIRAKALSALEMIAGLPIISENGDLTLRKARHPLLEKSLKKEKKEIVPLTLALTKEKHILLISGPNAGGKSVCLKTVGLLQYMFQWGMLVPTSEISEMRIFNDIFIDIGDNQSIENDLSTYSSHLQNLKHIVQNADENSLVLIDEFGSGTEPAAGGAIAEAVLAQLDKAGTYGVITTHYTNLKLYANESTGVVNGAMLFDGAAIQPLFKLEQGLPGNSFAFELARKIGLPEELVKDAEVRAGNDFVNIERNLRKIAKNKRVLDEKLARIKNTDKTLENLTDKYQKELGDIKELKRQIIDEAKREAKEIIEQSNKEVEKTIRDIRNAQAEREKTKEIRGKLDTFKKTLDEKEKSENDLKIDKKIEQILARKQREAERKAKRAGENALKQQKKEEKPSVDNSPLKVGDKVRIKDSDMVGEITQVTATKVSVSVGSITSKMSLDKVERISINQYKESSKKLAKPNFAKSESESITKRKLNFTPSIDIRGERLNDAMEIVITYLDDALMVGVPQVKILHGKGNGVLREEIRRYLKTIPGVKFRDEDIQMGGAGITVVDL